MIKKSIKRKMIAGIDKEELVLLKFTKMEAERDLRWEHSKEFEYRGEMYDIVERTSKGDSIFYWCWWDHEETQLNLALSDLAEKALGKDSKRNQKRQQLLDFYKNINPERAVFSLAIQIQDIENLNACYQFSCSTFHKKPSLPPPKLG